MNLTAGRLCALDVCFSHTPLSKNVIEIVMSREISIQVGGGYISSRSQMLWDE